MKKSVEADMIECLCWFDYYSGWVIGILKEIQVNGNQISYLDDRGVFHNTCSPVFRKEIEEMIKE